MARLLWPRSGCTSRKVGAALLEQERGGRVPQRVGRNSIGIMLVSGMIIGTCFTLFVLSAIYMLIARDRSTGRDDAETDKLMQELELESVEA